MIELPRVEGGFKCIVSDPAWQFDNKATRAAAEDHYGTLNQYQLAAMPVEEIAAKNAHLYLWTTDTHLDDAWWLASAWGFTPKQTIVWVKTKDIETRLYRAEDGTVSVSHSLVRLGENTEPPNLRLQIGMGNYYRHVHELVLFCTRGKAPANVKNFPSVIFAERGEHSAKPEILQDLAEHLSNGPGLEMFARRQRPGWTCWGNELTEEEIKLTLHRMESADE